ncbi:DNA glycosylase AlkZ-like family protein [Rhizohabitans arisaemae]|uniref:DNA glycosylase AlkZ-like family protein n=1 Tax=Rhizohabitans arisaemae TaxID=2720610 RepID=UPI0024B09DA6|nr:crosslink repair DNA glycosylase YcaQ family protein [Rhizohabitans arisaemae]
MTVDIDRAQVVAYRVHAQELSRATADAAALAVHDLGVQDSPAGSAALALTARLPEPHRGEGFARAWSFRGAPHLYRRADLPFFAAAQWPLTGADATARMVGAGTALRKAGIGGLEAFGTAAAALHEVVTGPCTKGEASGALTRALPEAFAYDCRPCKTRHVYDYVITLPSLPAGIELEPGTSPPTLLPMADWPELRPGPEVVGALITAYLRLLGPAGPGEVAGFIGTKTAEVKKWWPDGLARVRVEGRAAWIPEDRLAALRHAEPVSLIRLLPVSDPYLQARDRELLVPEEARRKELWKIIGSPNALLVDGEVAGVWRARKAGRDRLDVAVTAFESLAPGRLAAIEEEASRVGVTRDLPEVRVTYT